MSDAHSSDNAQPLPFSRLVVLDVASFVAAPRGRNCVVRGLAVPSAWRQKSRDVRSENKRTFVGRVVAGVGQDDQFCVYQLGKPGRLGYLRRDAAIVRSDNDQGFGSHGCSACRQVVERPGFEICRECLLVADLHRVLGNALGPNRGEATAGGVGNDPLTGSQCIFCRAK
jgi:hypothetical protein